MPLLMTTPQDLTISAGGKAVLACNAIGDPEPSISWRFGAKVIADASTSPNDDDDSHYKLLPNGFLRIEKTDMSDAGDYECLATNTMGTVLSRPARMVVMSGGTKDGIASYQRDSIMSEMSYSGLHFVHGPENAVIRLNDTITLHCSVEGMANDIRCGFQSPKLKQIYDR